MTTPELHHRDFPAELQIRSAGGDHFAEGLAVPFDSPTDIIEVRNGEPITYREAFCPGSFARALRAPHRVTLVYGHSETFPDRLGYAVELREDPAGLWMKAKLDRSRAEQAIDALTSSHSALSVAFASVVPRAGTEEPGSLVLRKSVHLAHIACVTAGAYTGAQLTSVRADGTDPDPTPAEVAAAEEQKRQRELLEWVDSLSTDPWAHLRQPR